MSISKRRIEAQEADINSEMRLCLVCQEYAEADDPSWTVEQSIVGPFTTVFLCYDCGPGEIGHCANCNEKSRDDAPVCDACLSHFRKVVFENHAEATCARCGSDIPPSEWDEYRESGMCSWCSHMTAKSEEEDVRVFEREWAPAKDLVVEEKTILEPGQLEQLALVLPTDFRLVTFLSQDPKKFYELTPRQFEELVADMLTQFGYRVQLGKGSKDGGVDVFAERTSDFGPELTVVQCKKHRIDRKVGEPTIKQLHADVNDRKASRGLLVTTSHFTKDALKYIDLAKYRLAGADIDQLTRWIQLLGSKGPIDI